MGCEVAGKNRPGVRVFLMIDELGGRSTGAQGLRRSVLRLRPLRELLAEVERLTAELAAQPAAVRANAAALRSAIDHLQDEGRAQRAEIDQLRAELAALLPVRQAAIEWYEAGGGGPEPDGRLHRANRDLRRTVAALTGPATEPQPDEEDER